MKLALAFVLAFSSAASAAPDIKAVSEPFKHNAVVKISGAGFGKKEPAAPLVWADFEDGLMPSRYGRKTKWDEVQSMEPAPRGWSGRGARASNGSGKWTLRVDHDFWTRDGQKIYIFKHQRMNFLITDRSQNWKMWRMWPAEKSYPNVYGSSSNGRVYVENVEPESGFWSHFPVPTKEWHAEEIIARASSDKGVKDGTFLLKYNGLEAAKGTLITRSERFPDYMTKNYVVHGVLANRGQWTPAWSDVNRLWVDNVYADTTWARVMLGDEPNAETCRRWEMQIPQTWSDGAITIRANTGAMISGANAYLYVYDEDGRVNERGYPVTFDDSGPDRRAPGFAGESVSGADGRLASPALPDRKGE